MRGGLFSEVVLSVSVELGDESWMFSTPRHPESVEDKEGSVNITDYGYESGTSPLSCLASTNF
jgi:hypothetical protein